MLICNGLIILYVSRTRLRDLKYISMGSMLGESYNFVEIEVRGNSAPRDISEIGVSIDMFGPDGNATAFLVPLDVSAIDVFAYLEGSGSSFAYYEGDFGSGLDELSLNYDLPVDGFRVVILGYNSITSQFNSLSIGISVDVFYDQDISMSEYQAYIITLVTSIILLILLSVCVILAFIKPKADIKVKTEKRESICQNCGKKTDAKFCPDCGSKLL